MDYSNFMYPKQTRIAKKGRKKSVSKITYEKVYNACKGKCGLCGATQNLELHHILGRGKDLTDNPDNCIMLCRNCHHEVVHQNNKKYRPILKEIRERIEENERKENKNRA